MTSPRPKTASPAFRETKGLTTPGIRAIRAAVTILSLAWMHSLQAQDRPEEVAPAKAAAVAVEGSVAAVLQQINAGGAEARRRQGRATYRGDITATLPAPAPSGAAATVFGHLRFGQGAGLGARPTYTGSLNSLAFESTDGSSRFAVLAELFYQLDMPLPAQDGSSPWGVVGFAAGKMDPFTFFDQNSVANDESSGFINNVFVHNPLLDSGGDLGADKYGFTPGIRVAWSGGSRHALGASIGVFGAGRGAEFSSSPGKPFVIAQVEVAPKDDHGEVAANYRLYAWTNSQATSFAGLPDRHVGWGVSVDRRMGADLNLFGRLGRRTRGEGTFNRAWTIGLELAGSGWGRPTDGVGFALGRLPTSDSYRAASAGAGAAGPASSSTETILEIFYRYAVWEKVELSPDFQLVSRPGGDPSAPTVRVFGVRVKVDF